MAMKIINCIQGTDEWFAARLGKITASRFGNVLCNSSGRNTYMIKLIAERLTGLAQDGYTNGAMQWGIETEPQARAYYEALNNITVQLAGFIELDENTGGSPDGLVGEDGILEIKCPNSTTHITTIIKGKMPTEYNPQVQGLLWITGRQWCDFISFDPRMNNRTFWSTRVFRDEKYIIVLQEAVKQFVKELNELIKKVTPNVPF
ncbi:MAG: lambda exonuclease family protein [Lutibacter sp.]|jgi:putative phage-type endonuclease